MEVKITDGANVPPDGRATHSRNASKYIEICKALKPGQTAEVTCDYPAQVAHWLRRVQEKYGLNGYTFNARRGKLFIWRELVEPIRVDAPTGRLIMSPKEDSPEYVSRCTAKSPNALADEHDEARVYYRDETGEYYQCATCNVRWKV